eukprot:3434444-Heterocapsa_arctica.AAC.1
MAKHLENRIMPLVIEKSRVAHWNPLERGQDPDILSRVELGRRKPGSEAARNPCLTRSSKHGKRPEKDFSALPGRSGCRKRRKCWLEAEHLQTRWATRETHNTRGPPRPGPLMR